MTHYMSSPEKSHSSIYANFVSSYLRIETTILRQIYSFWLSPFHSRGSRKISPVGYLEDCFQSKSYVGWFPV